MRVLAVDYTQEELAAMSLIDGLKPAARGRAFEDAGLGKYGPDNEHVKGLIDKGVIKLQGKNVVQDKAKAKAIMKKHPIPEKYKRGLSLVNPAFQFAPSKDDEDEKTASMKARVVARFKAAKVVGTGDTSIQGSL